MLGLLLGLVMAQEATVSATPIPTIHPENQFIQDYNFQVGEYQKAYIDYVNKKEIYTKYRTITTEKDKIDATKTALIIRNTMLKSFLMALRVSLDKFKTPDSSVTQKIQIELNRWEDWCQEQNLIITNYTNQPDITNWVNNFKTKYFAIQTVIYTALTQNQINQRLLSLNLLTTLAESMKSDPKTGDQLNEWLSALPIKSDLVTGKLNSAQSLTQSKQLSNRFNNFYPDAKIQLNGADTYLKNMLSDLRAVAIKLNQ